jgi:outer membrane protein
MIMNGRKLCGMLIALVFCIAPAAADDSAKVLTLADAVQMAADSNISIQRSKITIDQLKRTKDFSWNSISPTASASAGWLRPDEKTTYEYSEYVQGTISMSLAPSLYSSIKTAQLNYENGQITYDQAVRTVELNVRKAFYGLLYEKENIVMQQRNLDTAQQQYDQNTAKYKIGQVSELDMLTSRVTYEKLKPTLESAQVTFNNDLASFKQMLGIDLKTAVSLSGSLADVTTLHGITLGEAEQSVPDILAAEKNLEIARMALLSKRFGAYGPVVSGSWTYEKSKTDLSDNLTTTGNLSLGVTIPLDGYLPWSTGGQSVSSAKDSVKDAQLQLDNEKTTVAVEIENYLAQIKQSQGQLVSLRANIELAQKTYDMTLTAYNHGSKDLLSLQTAADSLMSAKVSLASEEYTFISAVLSLENILGVPFGTLGK